MMHKLLAALSFAGCMYFGTQLYVNFPAFAACYALCMWQIWRVMTVNEKSREQTGLSKTQNKK